MTYNELIERCRKIASTVMKGCVSDFTDCDCPRLASTAERYYKKVKDSERASFVWLVRDMGTWLLDMDLRENAPVDIEWYRSVYSNQTVRREYIITFNCGDWTIKQNRKPMFLKG